MLDFDKATPSDPDASGAWVHLLYAATMAYVQIFEHSLAFLSLVVTTDPHAAPQGSVSDQLPRIFERWWRAYQKDAAGPTLNRIRDKIPADLYDDVAAFIRRRNWLAHRFFIEQLDMSAADGRFERGTILKLVEMSAECGKLTKRIDALNASVRASWPPIGEETPPEFRQWVEEFGQLVMRRRVRADAWAAAPGRQKDSPS